MAEIIFCDLLKRPTVSYAVMRLTKLEYNTSRRITNIVSVVEGLGWELLYSSDRIPKHS